MTLHFKRAGSGSPIVLLHGLFGSLDNLGMIARHLSKHFDVISMDLPDHGLSARTKHFSYAQYAQWVVDTITHLGLAQPVLLGHSMGGKVAMHLALHYPSVVSKLIVADIAPVSYSSRHDAVFAGLQAVTLDKLRSRKDAEALMAQHINDPGVIQFLLRSLSRNDRNQFEWRFNLALLLRDYALLSDGIMHDVPFQPPTLFIKGGESQYITSAHRTIIQQLFPNAAAKIIQGTGHWLHAEKPVIFSKLVVDFIGSHE